MSSSAITVAQTTALPAASRTTVSQVQGVERVSGTGSRRQFPSMLSKVLASAAILGALTACGQQTMSVELSVQGDCSMSAEAKENIALRTENELLAKGAKPSEAARFAQRVRDKIKEACAQG